MNDSSTLAEDTQALNEYLARNISISRTRLNVQAFIGLFIFGWLMKLNYDDLDCKGFGWAFLIAFAVSFALVRSGEEVVFVIMPAIYIAAWIHTNAILSGKLKQARAKFLTIKAEDDQPSAQSAESSPTKNNRVLATDLDAEALVIIESEDDPIIARFLAYTYNAWQSGALEFYSPDFRAEALAVDLKEFITSAKAFVNIIIAANKAKAFAEGEYLVGYHDRTFLLTNIAIYFFPERKLSNPPTMIELKNINSYSLKSNWFGVAIRIEQKAGPEIVFPKIKGGPDENIVKHFADLG